MTFINQILFPKYYIEGPTGNVADTNAGGLLTGGGSGTPTLAMGPRVCIAGPSGYVANVDSNGNLSTTNG
jgi:hypothetical protein